MASHPDDNDPARWHRFFAAQANNRAWDLAEGRLDARHDAEMLAAAHAAAWHWDAVGTELHRMRATMLLSLVNALAGHGATALAQAEAVRGWFVPDGATPREDTPGWEVTFVHAIHALAAHVAGQAAAHAASWTKAQQALDAIADPEDRAIVLKTWALVPAPGAVS